MESDSIPAEGMKSFVKHLCLLSKRHEQREKSRDILDMQMRKVKQILLTQKPRRWLIEKELRELEKKISIALEYERKLIGMRESDSILFKQLKDKVFSLEYQLKQSETIRNSELEKNTELISDLVNSISDLREKMGKLMEREERLKQLDKKIKRKTRSL